MSQGGGRQCNGKVRPGTSGVLAGLICSFLLALFGCGSDDSSDGAFYDPYKLGGQTGSLIPGCGVAPLSAEGLGVPAGDVLAVLYTRDCSDPEELALLTRDGTGTIDTSVELEPLGDDGTYLVRAADGLPPGDYQLTFGGSAPSDLQLEGGAPAVPTRVGPLRLEPSEMVCPDVLRFELELDADALAYAPLTRFMLSIDGGVDQVWVDYGALPIEADAEGSRGVLELPRCGASVCLDHGSHSLLLSAQIADEVRAPEPIELDFELDCPMQSAAARPSDVGYGATCALGGATHRSGHGICLVAAACLVWLALRRRRV